MSELQFESKSGRPTANLVTIKELSQMFPISAWTIYQMIKSDPTFPVKNAGIKKKYLVNPIEFMSYIERKRTIQKNDAQELVRRFK